jgi:hypothetical protein
MQNGQPYSGSANLVFKLFDASSGGNLLGTQTLSGVDVSDGLFTVLLNASGEFGATAFNGDSRWLEVTANGTLLTPRQALTATPYAEFAAAPWIQPVAGGSAIAYIAGDVGIGTTSPSATLHVNGNIGVGVANIPAGLTAELGGTSTPILNLDVNFRHPNLHTAFVGGALRIDSRDDAADPLFQFISRPAGSTTESIIAALTRNGNFGIGTSAPTAKLEVVNTSVQDTLELRSDAYNPVISFGMAGTSRRGFIRWTDQFAIGNDISLSFAILKDDGSWYTLSDRRLKTDITPAEGLLGKALALRPAEFYMKNQDRTRDPLPHLGLVAQEVQPVLPDLVSGSDMLSLNYDRLGVVAIGAIQEQQAIISDQKKTIDAQQERITRLEDSLRDGDARINDLTARLEKLEASVIRTYRN